MTVLAKPFIGELGHELMFWQGLLRHMKFHQYRNHRMLVCCLPGHECLYEFADEIITVPGDLLSEEMFHNQTTWLSESDNSNGIDAWFNKKVYEMYPQKNFVEREEEKKGEFDTYIQGLPMIVDPDQDCRHKYRHGYHDLMGNRIHQRFTLLQPSDVAWHKVSVFIGHDNFRWGKYVVIYPRHKPGIFARRNWAHWRSLITYLNESGLITVVVGIESLTDEEARGVANLEYVASMKDSDLDFQIGLLANASFAVTPISGCTFLSILSGCPTFVIGNVKCSHHLLYRNVFQTKVEYVSDIESPDDMPGIDCLRRIFRRIDIFKKQCLDGRFSV